MQLDFWATRATSSTSKATSNFKAYPHLGACVNPFGILGVRLNEPRRHEGREGRERRICSSCFALFASSRFVQIIKKPYNFGVSNMSCFDKIDRTSSNPISTSTKISPTVFCTSFSPPWQGGAGGGEQPCRNSNSALDKLTNW